MYVSKQLTFYYSLIEHGLAEHLERVLCGRRIKYSHFHAYLHKYDRTLEPCSCQAIASAFSAEKDELTDQYPHVAM
jgi:hypothetical protein